jgi:hypothetical protein
MVTGKENDKSKPEARRGDYADMGSECGLAASKGRHFTEDGVASIWRDD